MWEWDVDCDVIYLSPSLLKILGFEEGARFKSGEWMERVHPDDVSNFKNQINSCISGSNAFYEASYRVRDYNGGWIRILDKGYVVSWKNLTEPAIISGTKTNITFQRDSNSVTKQLGLLDKTLKNQIEPAGIVAAETDRIFQKKLNLIPDQLDLLDKTLMLSSVGSDGAKGKENSFIHWLNAILRLTGSEFGFIGSFLDKEGEKLYKVRFLRAKHSGVNSNESEEIYELSSHFRASFQSNKPFVCNNPAGEPFNFPGVCDPKVLKNYMILPIYVGYKLIAIVGVANRLEGYDEITISKIVQPAIEALSNLVQENHQEFKLVSEQDALKLFISYTPLVVAMFDSDLCYLAVSDSWLKLSNMQDKPLVGTLFTELSGNHISKEAYQCLKICLQGEIVKNNEDSIIFTDGSIMWVKWDAYPWYKEEGSVGGIIIFAEDITESKTMEAKMNKMVADLSRSNRELERFAYGCCHDMKEPLRGMASMAHLIIKHNAAILDEATQEYLQCIINGANRLQRLIRDILVYSRAEEDEIIQESVSIQKVLCEIKDIYAIQFLENKVVIKEGFLPDCVWGNREQISQIFQNIIENAIKFRSEMAPQIFITSEAYDTDFWHFSIKDNGIGIEEKYFKDVFVVFKRLHSRRNYRGSGIGLSLCQKIVEFHGGKIWISSNVDGGSTIHFTLPALPSRMS